MTVSVWQRSDSAASTRADLVVVGGGVCGLAAAIEAERRGLRVVVVERHAVGSGASGRNAGFLMRGAADNYVVARRLYGEELARRLWRISEENLEVLRSLGVGELGSYRAVPSCLVAFDETERGELIESHERLVADGFASGLIDTAGGAGPGDRLFEVARSRGERLVALVNPDDASCDPCELLSMLRGRVKGRILEHQEVCAIEPCGSGARVVTAAACVEAERVLLATNAYAALLVPSLLEVVRPRRGQMLAIEAPECVLSMSYYANRGSEYFRHAGGARIVVGGCRTTAVDEEVGYEDRTTDGVQGAIERFAMRVLGLDRLDVRARWSGVMGFSADGLPLIGRVEIQTRDGGVWRDAPVWFCGGFTGHGMSLGVRSAQVAVAEMVDGTKGPFPLSRLRA